MTTNTPTPWRFEYHVAKAATVGPQGVFSNQRECARFIGHLFRNNECHEVRVWRVQRVPKLVRRQRAKVTP